MSGHRLAGYLRLLLIALVLPAQCIGLVIASLGPAHHHDVAAAPGAGRTHTNATAWTTATQSDNLQAHHESVQRHRHPGREPLQLVLEEDAFDDLLEELIRRCASFACALPCGKPDHGWRPDAAGALIALNGPRWQSHPQEVLYRPPIV